MFSTTLQAAPAARCPAGQHYRQIGLETSTMAADPHRLVALLFDGLLEAIAQGRGAIRNGQIAAKGLALARAARIVNEGLKAALNLSAGGELAQDLHDLYAYIELRLTQANLRNDDQALAECVRLITPLSQAWAEITPKGTR
jgi:flagellar protein FliS